MEDKLTMKQEGFAYDIGYRRLNQTDAYKNNYKCEKWKDTSIYPKASTLAKLDKVSARIEYWRLQRYREDQLSFSWSMKEAEDDLRMLLTKNKNDIMRAEKKGEPVKHATNDAVLRSIAELNKMASDINTELDELNKRKLVAETELAEAKNKLLKEKAVDEDDKTIYEINL